MHGNGWQRQNLGSESGLRGGVVTLLVLDVLPATATCDQSELAGLRAQCQLSSEGRDVADLAAAAVVGEFVYDISMLPPLAAGLGRWLCATEPLAKQQLGALLPDLERTGGDPATVAYASEEARALLLQHEIRTWAALGRLSCQQLARWTKERVRGEELAALAVRQAAATALALVPGRCTRSARGMDAELQLIAAWGFGELGLDTVGEALNALPSQEEVPSEISEAWERLSLASTRQLSGELAARYNLDAAVKRVLAFDARIASILVGRVYETGRRRTLDELGGALGVTRERVRQIENGAREEIARRLDDPTNAVVRRAAARLGRELGACSRIGELPSPIRAALVRDETNPASIGTRVLLDLAGPYEVFDRWVVRAPAERLIGATRELLEAASRDATLRREDALALLVDAGVPNADGGDWLTSACECRVLDGRVVSWRGSMADKAERILAVAGKPMTIDEIAAALGPDTNLRSLLGQIQVASRFLRLGKKHYGLTLWGGEEYTKIEDEIAQEIERQGGSAHLDHLVQALCDQFGVSESSVRAYANDPPFVRLADGRVTIGNGDERRFERRAMELTRDCFRLGSHWALRVVVDSELLRGSGRLAPIAVMHHLGIPPGGTATLQTPYGEIALRWGRQPQLGSLRRAAEALGCEQGDLLFLELAGELRATFVVMRRSDLAGYDGPMRLAFEVGATAHDPDQAMRAASDALGFAEADFSPADLRRRLQGRGEDDLAALVPRVESHADEDILTELIGLGE